MLQKHLQPKEKLDQGPVFVARQPVFQRDMAIWGYELLIRSNLDTLSPPSPDSETAPSQIITTGLTVARVGMAPGAKVMINFSEKMILENAPFVLPNGYVVELSENVSFSTELFKKCLELKDFYLLAINVYQGRSLPERFKKLVDIVKIDVLNMEHKLVKDTVAKLEGYNGLLIADKVENQAKFEVARRMGFHLFQGFFFSRSITASGKKLESNELVKLELLREMEKTDFDPEAFSRIIQRDAVISYRLLGSINSPGMGLLYQIHSISHAVRLLGEHRVRQWFRILIMSDIATSRKDRELLQLSATRGYFLSELSRHYPGPLESDAMFLLGLFSLLHVILNQRMEEALSHLALDSRIATPLLGRETEASHWLKLAAAYEQGDWGRVDELIEDLGVDPAHVARIYNKALANSSFFLPESEESV